MTNRNVFCALPGRIKADGVLRDLKEAEFSTAEISVLFVKSDGGQSERPALEKHWPFEASDRTLTIDSIVAAGPIATAMNGMNAGDIAGGLADFGVPEKEAAIYSRVIEEGGALIAVHTSNPEMAERARVSFNTAGGQGVMSMMEVQTAKIISRPAFAVR